MAASRRGGAVPGFHLEARREERGEEEKVLESERKAP